MSTKQRETNDANDPDSQSKGPRPAGALDRGNIGRHHANPVISKRRKSPSKENKILMECYLLREPKARGYRKRMLNLWLNKCIMFWVLEQRLVDQANTTRRNNWMTDLEIEDLERNLPKNDSCKGEERSAGDTGSNLGEVRDILTALKADEEIGNFVEEEVAIVTKIAEVLERRQKDKLPALRDIPKKKLLEETTKVD